MTKPEENTLALMAALVLLVPAIIISPLLFAWAATVLWAWYLEGFCGLPALPLTVALGVRLVFSVIRPGALDHIRDEFKKSNTMQAWTILAYAYLGPLVAIGFGWVLLRAVEVFS
jgi:hypothetical protein